MEQRHTNRPFIWPAWKVQRDPCWSKSAQKIGSGKNINNTRITDFTSSLNSCWNGSKLTSIIFMKCTYFVFFVVGVVNPVVAGAGSGAATIAQGALEQQTLHKGRWLPKHSYPNTAKKATYYVISRRRHFVPLGTNDKKDWNQRRHIKTSLLKQTYWLLQSLR